ncbi:MAG: hypothetical protein AB7E71_25160 [Dongiaceae bacterium]
MENVWLIGGVIGGIVCIVVLGCTVWIIRSLKPKSSGDIQALVENFNRAATAAKARAKANTEGLLEAQKDIADKLEEQIKKANQLKSAAGVAISEADADRLKSWASYAAHSAFARAAESPDPAVKAAGVGATSDLTTSGFQALILINGGAVIAVLALLGDVFGTAPGGGTSGLSADLDWIKGGIFVFAIGLVFAIGGIGAAFWAQVAIQKGWPDKVADNARKLSFVLGVVSLLVFVGGAYTTVSAFSDPSTATGQKLPEGGKRDDPAAPGAPPPANQGDTSTQGQQGG